MDMDIDIDDLVGSVPRKSTRLDTALDNLTASKRMGIRNDKTGGYAVEDVHNGVTVSWLAQVFSMDPKTVKQRLADCPPLYSRKAGYVYALPVACQYLVKPAITPEQFMKNIKQADLPPAMQDSFWSANLKRQKYEENAGDLWRTADVRLALSGMFQTIKFTIQLWADNMQKQVGATEKQREWMVKASDALQKEIYDAVVKYGATQKQGSQKSEMQALIGEGQPTIQDEDDDWSDLV